MLTVIVDTFFFVICAGVGHILFQSYKVNRERSDQRDVQFSVWGVKK